MTARPLAIWLFLFFSLGSLAQAPELAARLDVKSLMALTQELAPFVERVDPKSSGLLVLGTAGFALNPQFVNYDLSRPFSALAYSGPEGGGFGKWSFCGVLWRRSEKSSPYLKALGLELSARDFESRSALASSEALFDLLPADLRRDPSSETPPGSPELALRLNAGLATRKGFLKELFASVKDGPSDPAKLEALQAKAVRLEAYEALFKQASSLALELSFPAPKRARVSVKLEPQAGSSLEAFLKGQAASGGAVMPRAISLPGGALYGASRLKADALRLGALSGFYGKLSEAVGEVSKAKAVSDFALQLLSEASEGGAGFCVGRHRGKAFGAVLLNAPGGAAKRAERSLGSFASRTSTPKLYLLRQWKSGLASYCLFDDARIWLLSGRFDEDEASFALSSRKELEPRQAEAGLLAFAAGDEDASAPKLLSVWSSGDVLELRMELSPSDMDRLPLPAPEAPAGPGGSGLSAAF